MPIFKKDYDVQEIYKGEIPVPEVYRGPEQVFPMSNPPISIGVVTGDGSKSFTIEGGHTYKAMHVDHYTSDNSYIFDAVELPLSSDTTLIWNDDIRIQTGYGSTKETYTIDVSATANIFGSSIPLTSSYDNSLTYAAPNASDLNFNIRGKFEGLTISTEFEASRTWDTYIEGKMNVGSYESEISVIFSSPVRLIGLTYYTTSTKQYLSQSPEILSLQIRGIPVPRRVSALQPDSPGVDEVASTGLGTDNAESKVLVDNSVVSDSVPDNGLNFIRFLSSDRSTGASKYSYSYSGTWTTSLGSEDNWERYYKDKTTIYRGSSYDIYQSQYVDEILGIGIINSVYMQSSRTRKNSSDQIAGYSYMSIQEMDGVRYNNIPVYLMVQTSNGGQVSQGVLHLWTYEYMKSYLGNAFTDTEYPPIAYIDYTIHVDSNGDVTYTLHNCTNNPDGIVT